MNNRLVFAEKSQQFSNGVGSHGFFTAEAGRLNDNIKARLVHSVSLCSDECDRVVNCNESNGICFLKDLSILVWTPLAKKQARNRFASTCLEKTGRPITGIALGENGDFGTVIDIDSREVDLTKRITWVSEGLSRPWIPRILQWADRSPLAQGVLNVSLCGDSQRSILYSGEIFWHQPEIGFKVMSLKHFQNMTWTEFVGLWQIQKHRVIANEKVQRIKYLADPLSAFRSDYPTFDNVSVFRQEEFLASQQCHTLKSVPFQLLKTNGHWPSLSEVDGKYPVLLHLPQQWIYGYWSKVTNFVFPRAEVSAMNITSMLSKIAVLTPGWYLERIGLENTFAAKSTTRLNEYAISQYHPYLSYAVQPLLSRRAYREFTRYLKQYSMGSKEMPRSIFHLWLFAVMVYSFVLFLVLHCTPFSGVLKFVNPFYITWRAAKKLYKKWKRSPTTARLLRFQREGQEAYLLRPRGEERTVRPAQRIGRQRRQRSASPTLRELARDHYLKMRVSIIRPIYHAQAENADSGKFTAACLVKILESPYTSLLDTGATISLIDYDVANILGLTVVPGQVSTAEALSGHEIRLEGKAKTSITLGKRKLKDIDLYLVKDLGDYDLILGQDAMSKMGVVSFDFNQGKLHFRDPKNSGTDPGLNYLKVPVTLPEDVVLPANTETILMANAAYASEAEWEMIPMIGFIKKTQVRPVGALVTTSNGKVPVQLLNSSSDSIKLYKGTTVGLLTKIETVKHQETIRMLMTATAAASGSRNKVAQISADITLEKPSPQKVEARTSFSKEGVVGTDANTRPSLSKDGRIQLNLDNSILTNEQKVQMENFLNDNADVFSTDPQDIGCIPGVEHAIDTGDNAPIKQRPYRTEFSNRAEIRKQIQQMLKSGIIRESVSPYASPVVLVNKKDGSKRMVIDYRKLNSISKPVSFPLPLITDLLDSLGKAKFFSSVDVTSGYHHIRVKEEDIPKTAFTCFEGLYEYNRMPFGLTAAVSTFQRAMQCVVLTGLTPSICLVYLDDCLCYSETFEEHLAHLQLLFDRFRKYSLKLKLSKCQFCPKELEYLGHVITRDGLKPDSKKVEAMAKFPQPTDVSELRRFLGILGYHRRFVRSFSTLARPLFDLLKKNVPYVWAERQQDAFDELRHRMVTAPVLAYPQFDRPFVFETDACQQGVGCVLSQEDGDGNLRPIAFASRSLTQAEKNYAITELELLAIQWSLKLFRAYAYGHKCKVITDHQALKWVLNQASPSGRLNRWSLELQEFDLEVTYRPGRKNEKADALSRAPLVAALTGPMDPATAQEGELVKAQRMDAMVQNVKLFLNGEPLPAGVDKNEVKRLAKQVEIDDGGLLVLKEPQLRRGTAKPRFVPFALRARILWGTNPMGLWGPQDKRSILEWSSFA